MEIPEIKTRQSIAPLVIISIKSVVRQPFLKRQNKQTCFH